MESKNKIQLTIAIKDGLNKLIEEISGYNQVTMVLHRNYEKGDKILFYKSSETKFLMIKADSVLGETLVYSKDNFLEIRIPFGEETQVYPSVAFKGLKHEISIRVALEEEIYTYRNLAVNVMDQRGAVTFFPHATANIETRNESVFAARTAIDGFKDSCGHGLWPYTSWGPDNRENAEIMFEFGREVQVDKIAFYIRSDFPHDSYWRGVTVLFSNGYKQIVQLEKIIGPQYITLDKIRVEWIKLMDLEKAADESEFPALTQFEAYGKDIEE